mmetsp:Transcript_27997/g.52516  ORF Transcript_27997/g.52516 Transcript_27997/m.52516 type:complete len:150 (+) Transcript_27997:58-507(+)
METPIGQALASAATSAQWSTLDAVLRKVNSKIGGRPMDARAFDEFLRSVGDQELQAHGVWRHSFGPKYKPILLVNPAYARAVARDPEGGCSCPRKAPQDQSAAVDNYFNSQNYNAGRHALEASGHIPSCALWRPPTTGHLHSWRRGFDD